MTALIFDCDGVLADTERDGHLAAFNQTFEEFGVPVHWSVEEYGQLLRIGGGKERLRGVFTPSRLAESGLPADPAAQDGLISAWHRRKTEIFTGLVAAGRIPARPGIGRLANAANEAGWQLAVASTSAEASVRSVLARAVGDRLSARFSVFAGDIVAHKKPAPDVYRLAAEVLRIAPGQAVVIEDSANGLRSATAAGLGCLVTVNDYTRGEDFDSAAMVVSSLGDPGSEPVEVLLNRTGHRPGPMIELTDLLACASGSTGHLDRAREVR